MSKPDAEPQPLVRREAAIALSILAFVFVVVPIGALVWATSPQPGRLVMPVVGAIALLGGLQIAGRSRRRSLR